MFDVFNGAKALFRPDPISIDNNTFKLHYKVTFTILVVCSMLVTSKQFMGDPIDCIVAEIPNNVMDTYCWIHSTFTVPNREKTGVLGHDLSHPGVNPLHQLGEGEKIIQHKYYQWVCFTLVFQAILCYIPKYMWKHWEGGKLKTLLQRHAFANCRQGSEKETHQVARQLFFHQQKQSRILLRPILFLRDSQLREYCRTDLLNGSLLGRRVYNGSGTNVLAMTEKEFDMRDDPMARVFPKVAKCTFNKFGPSGTVETFDGLCVLPLNIVNEKIYVFLWFWFIILSALTGMQIVYRFMTSLAPRLRELLLRGKGQIGANASD